MVGTVRPMGDPMQQEGLRDPITNQPHHRRKPLTLKQLKPAQWVCLHTRDNGDESRLLVAFVSRPRQKRGDRHEELLQHNPRSNKPPFLGHGACCQPLGGHVWVFYIVRPRKARAWGFG